MVLLVLGSSAFAESPDVPVLLPEYVEEGEEEYGEEEEEEPVIRAPGVSVPPPGMRVGSSGDAGRAAAKAQAAAQGSRTARGWGMSFGERK